MSRSPAFAGAGVNSEGCNGPPFGGERLDRRGSQCDRDRAAVGRAHQTDDKLRPVATVVAAVAMLRQFATASFEVSGGDVVEQQRAILQVAAGQRGFDKGLL